MRVRVTQSMRLGRSFAMQQRDRLPLLAVGTAHRASFYKAHFWISRLGLTHLVGGIIFAALFAPVAFKGAGVF